MIRGLEDLDVLVVAAGNDGRPGVEAEQAPLGDAAVLGAVGADAADAEPDRPGGLGGGAGTLPVHARLRRRHPAVGRIDDERGPTVVDDPRPPVEPEVVVGAHVAARRQRLGADLARPVRLGRALDGRGLELGRLLRRQLRLLRPVLGALQRGQGPEVPDALQVGGAVRQAGHVGRRLGAGGNGQDHGQCGQHQHGAERSFLHLIHS